MSEDFDFGKVAFIVIAMIAAFVQWAWKAIQEGRERKKYQEEASPEHRTLREVSRDKQVILPDRSRPVPPSVPPATLRGAFEQIKEELRKAQELAKPAPPPLPGSTTKRTQPPAVVRAMPSPAPAPLSPLTAPPQKAAESLAKVEPAASSRDDFSNLRVLLMEPKALRNAVLLREILGPPKALQSSGESLL
ncbi:hypothetical protein BH11VER1_BH11VER1_22680 [soil metagenome]